MLKILANSFLIAAGRNQIDRTGETHPSAYERRIHFSPRARKPAPRQRQADRSMG